MAYFGDGGSALAVASSSRDGLQPSGYDYDIICIPIGLQEEGRETRNTQMPRHKREGG